VIAGALGLGALFAALLGIVLVHAGVLTPLSGFRLLFPWGLLGGLLGLLVGLLALWRTRADPPARRVAWCGVLAGGGLLASALVVALPGRGLPTINDVTTDLDDPPAFVAAARDPELAGRDLGHPAEFAEPHRAAYSGLGPILTASAPDAALERARETAEALGWEVVEVDPATGRLEARDVSRLYRFVDDVVVRVRPEGSGSRVDVRSRSRVGRGDLGANAARIRAFAAAYPR
jgi:uncharacterized protein (DUF1499 family)